MSDPPVWGYGVRYTDSSAPWSSSLRSYPGVVGGTPVTRGGGDGWGRDRQEQVTKEKSFLCCRELKLLSSLKKWRLLQQSQQIKRIILSSNFKWVF